MAGKWFTECDHSAFISYAFGDDIAHNRWVTCFNKELNMTLPTQLRGIRVPDAHLSSVNGAVSGILDDQLSESIAKSFAMILVVHNNYADSEWCLKELAYFKSLFGKDGFRERLFIIALSEPAMDKVRKTAEWKLLTGGKDLISMPFFQEQRRDRPIGIYNDNVPGVATTAFWNPFLNLREEFVSKINQNVELQRSAMAPAAAARADALAAAPASVAVNALVRIFIESNQNEVDHWESVGAQTVKSWGAIVKDDPPPQLYVRPSGLPIDDIDQHRHLDNADGVILLWGEKTRDSLAAQIKKVEDKLTGPDLVPCVVAYLIPPQDVSDKPIPAYGWPVVRFNAPQGRPIEVMPQDSQKLEAFLSKVLARKKRRANAAREAPLASQL